MHITKKSCAHVNEQMLQSSADLQKLINGVYLPTI
jgi:hypothetical protein